MPRYHIIVNIFKIITEMFCRCKKELYIYIITKTQNQKKIMRTLETINQIKKASELSVNVVVNKAFTFMTKTKLGTEIKTCKKSKGFDVLKSLSEASVKISHSDKVVNSTIKKIKYFGFEVEEVEKHVWDFGAVDYWVIIKKT